MKFPGEIEKKNPGAPLQNHPKIRNIAHIKFKRVTPSQIKLVKFREECVIVVIGEEIQPVSRKIRFARAPLFTEATAYRKITASDQAMSPNKQKSSKKSVFSFSL